MGMAQSDSIHCMDTHRVYSQYRWRPMLQRSANKKILTFLGEFHTDTNDNTRGVKLLIIIILVFAPCYRAGTRINNTRSDQFSVVDLRSPPKNEEIYPILIFHLYLLIIIIFRNSLIIN
jgi:hypothetical protein